MVNEGGNSVDVIDNHSSNEISEHTPPTNFRSPIRSRIVLPTDADIIPVGIVRSALFQPLTQKATTTRTLSRTLCVDSGSTHDMFKERDNFHEYEPLTNTYILAADDTPVPVTGRGTISIILLGQNSARIRDCLHVPTLSMSLLSVRVHRRRGRGRGRGCYFHADEGECSIAFPTFTLDIDDEADCTLPYNSAPVGSQVDYDEDNLQALPTTSTKRPSRSCRRTGPSLSNLTRPLLAFQVQTRSQKRQAESTQNPGEQLPATTTNAKTQSSQPINKDVEQLIDNMDLWDVPESPTDDWDTCSTCSIDSDSEIETDEIRDSDPEQPATVNEPALNTSSATDWNNDKLANNDTNEDDNDDNYAVPTPRKGASLPNYYIPESHSPTDKVRVTDHRLHLLLGNRKLRDYGVLSTTFKNCIVTQHGEIPLSIGDVVTNDVDEKENDPGDPGRLDTPYVLTSDLVMESPQAAIDTASSLSTKPPGTPGFMASETFTESLSQMPCTSSLTIQGGSHIVYSATLIPSSLAENSVKYLGRIECESRQLLPSARAKMVLLRGRGKQPAEWLDPSWQRADFQSDSGSRQSEKQ